LTALVVSGERLLVADAVLRDRHVPGRGALELLRRARALGLPREHLVELALLERWIVGCRRRRVELDVRDAEVLVLLSRVDRIDLDLDGRERAGRLLDHDLLPALRVLQGRLLRLAAGQKLERELLDALIGREQVRALLISVANAQPHSRGP